MMRRGLIFLITAAVLVTAGWKFRGPIAKWFNLKPATPVATASQPASSDPNTPAAEPDPANPGRKVLYWYDPMHPVYKTNKPGIAPDCGMQLVAKFTDDAAPAVQGGKSNERKVLFWYDAMNPAHRYDHAGKAPDGMDLVPKYPDEENGSAAAPGTVKIDATKQQLIGVRTATVERESLMREIRTTGQLMADEQKISHVHLKVSGWIEQVYVDYIGQLIKKGQPLFALYSPDLVSTQEEYLIAKRGEKYLGNSPFPDVSQGSESLLRSSRERLKLWDISDEQIKKLDETGEVSRTLTFYSPVNGFVMDRKAFPHTAINPDMELYTVADLSDIWVNADIYEYEAPYVRVGQRATMQLSYYPGKTYVGRVTFIYPTVDPVARTLKVRLEFSNPNYELKPQMFADVLLNINYGTQIVIPQEAVLDSGSQQTVFIAHEGGYFEPRMVKIGPKLQGKVVVLSGLNPGETIVSSGNFLIDSESRLASATSEMKH
jgi:Cu(I)/Ag(I) efflux system membrane fusion protein/cobalt-zinc-cadmium efflux system membrane fusion protein